MTNNQNQKRYDLEDRTLEFGKRIIRLGKSLPKNQINVNLVDQLVRAGTSVGSNYREANQTQSKKDFRFKIGLSRKEAKETEYWLQLIIEANPELKERVSSLLGEAVELVKIFATIFEKSRNF